MKYIIISITSILILSLTSCGDQKVKIDEKCLQLPGAKLPAECTKK